MAEVMIDPDEMMATVRPRVNSKYARKLVQDKLKAETVWKGGWEITITNLYEPDNYYAMKLTNPFKETAELASKMIQPMPLHFERTHLTGTTIGGLVFLYCPIGNICSWALGDVENKWCDWCKKSFKELRL